MSKMMGKIRQDKCFANNTTQSQEIQMWDLDARLIFFL